MDMDRLFAAINQGVTLATTSVTEFFERVFGFGEVLPIIADALAVTASPDLFRVSLLAGGLAIAIVALAGAVMALRHRHGYGVYHGLFGWQSAGAESANANTADEAATAIDADSTSQAEEISDNARRLIAIEQQMADLRKEFDEGRIGQEKYISDTHTLYQSAQAIRTSTAPHAN